MAVRLYKYMPSKFVDSFLNGRLLLRNLSYYRQCEDPARGDLYEGRHIDRPGGGVVIERQDPYLRVEGDFAFINSTRVEQIFAFCVSTAHAPELYDEFKCDACVEISDPDQFVRDVRGAVRRLRPYSDWVLVDGPVEYYKAQLPASRDIENPRELPFFKPARYQLQQEYRIIVARHRAFELTQRIVHGPNLSETESASNEVSHRLWLHVPRRRRYLAVHRSASRGA